MTLASRRSLGAPNRCEQMDLSGTASLTLLRRAELSPHLEEQIYGGFYSSADEYLVDEFHKAEWPQRLEISGQFADRRLRGLSRRLIYFDAPNVMPDRMRSTYARAIAARIHARNQATRWVTLDEAIEDGETMLADLAPDDRQRLDEHLTRLRIWREEARQVLEIPIVG